MDKLPLTLPWWYITCNHKINNIHVPWVGFCDLEEHVVPKRIVDGQFLWIFKLHSGQVIGNIIFYSLSIFYF